MLFIYNLLLPVLFLIYLPFYLVHIFRRGGLTSDFWQRFGFFSTEKKRRLYSLRHPVWVHAVSVGETVAAVSFIKTWLKRHPEERFVFSCGTSTGYATACKKMPAEVEKIYCPIDFIWAVCHVLRLIHPKTLVIFEVEIWPNLITLASKCGIKVALVNGRMSDKSSRGYSRWGFVFRPIFNSFSALCMQTEEDAARIRRVIGDSPKIHVCNTMKFDQIPDAGSADKKALLDECFGPEKRLLLTIGSTHSGEEELVCSAFAALKKSHPELKMVLVPRHQERAAEVEEVLKQHQLTWRRLAPAENVPAQTAPVDVLLVNTTGELMNFYACADITYVGKSLAGQTGGHNIIEPAIFGKPILYGFHMENFREVAAIFRKHEAAVEIQQDEDFLPELEKLVKNQSSREELGKKARAVVEQYRGAIDRTLDIIE